MPTDRIQVFPLRAIAKPTRVGGAVGEYAATAANKLSAG
jgi:hypothetical protein